MSDLFDLQQTIEQEFEERFADYIDTVAVERKTDPETEEFIELPEYWSDAFSEIADSCAPVYYSDATGVWIELGCPDPEELMINDDTRIVDLIQHAVYEYCYQYVWDIANKYQFED